MLCPICKQELPHEFHYNEDNLRLEGGTPVVVSEIPVEVPPMQPHNISYNPDGSISIKLSAITFIELLESPGGISYLLAKADVDFYESTTEWHRIFRSSDEQLEEPKLFKVENGIATFGPGKLGYSRHLIGTDKEWVKVNLGLHITPKFLLSEEQFINIQEELTKI